MPRICLISKYDPTLPISIHAGQCQRENVFVPETFAIELIWKEWICLDRQTSHKGFTSRRLSNRLFYMILTSFTPKLSLGLKHPRKFAKILQNHQIRFPARPANPLPYIIEEILNAEAVDIIATFKNRNKWALP